MFARLTIPQSLFDALLDHAQRERPNECCGLLAGTVVEGVGVASHHYPLVNELRSPTEFLSEPKGMFLAVKDMRARGIDILAVYHSHPASAPVPSRKDLERNFSPDVMNLIVGLAGDSPEVLAWWLLGTEASPGEWALEAKA